MAYHICLATRVNKDMPHSTAALALTLSSHLNCSEWTSARNTMKRLGNDARKTIVTFLSLKICNSYENKADEAITELNIPRRWVEDAALMAYFKKLNSSPLVAKDIAKKYKIKSLINASKNDFSKNFLA